MQELKNINIADVIGKYVQLKKSGTRLVGCCPFHEEKTPSFFVFQERFKCFGCGESGDAADFIQKIMSCSFQDALKHLGIKPGFVSKIKVERNQYEKKLVNGFQDWCLRADVVLARSVIQLREIIHNFKTEQHLDDFGFMIHNFELYKYWREILRSGTEQDKHALYTKYNWLGDLL